MNCEHHASASVPVSIVVNAAGEVISVRWTSVCLRVALFDWLIPDFSAVGYWYKSLRNRPLPQVSGYTGQLGDCVIEGWYGSDHLILFNEAEIASASDRYAVSQLLPGYKVIGLSGWNDFVLEDSSGATYCVPTVPAVAEQLSPYALPSAGSMLCRNDRFQGKIKWYVKPIVFGGDPQSEANIIWVSHEQHAELVKYWNSLYLSLKSQ